MERKQTEKGMAITNIKEMLTELQCTLTALETVPDSLNEISAAMNSLAKSTKERISKIERNIDRFTK